MSPELFLQGVRIRLLRFKARAVLMGLGIVVSVTATVLMSSLGDTVRGTFARFIGRLYPDDTIVLTAGASFMGGGGAGRDNLREKDVLTVVSAVPGIVAWDPTNSAGRREVKAGDRSSLTLIAGASARSPEVHQRTVTEGEFFSAADVVSRARVALIGTTAASRLFPDGVSPGATVFIDNAPFRIEGVLEPLGMSPHGDDQDDVLIVPYTVIMDSLAKVDTLRGALLKIGPAEEGTRIAAQIIPLMRELHHIGSGQSDDFAVATPAQMRQMAARMFGTINVFVRLISGGAFLISALVLVSIMLASVRERTAEIGLRKAVGADASAIRLQIVAEVVAIAGAGCILGVLLAWPLMKLIAPMLAARFGFVGAALTVPAVLIASASALITGLIAALWPAMRAARLNPVDALRVN